jgi:hypothetical protein
MTSVPSDCNILILTPLPFFKLLQDISNFVPALSLFGVTEIVTGGSGGVVSLDGAMTMVSAGFVQDIPVRKVILSKTAKIIKYIRMTDNLKE